MKLVLAITGASGAVYAKLFLEALRGLNGLSLHVVASKNARRVFLEEIGIPLAEFWPECRSPDDFDVPYVSGSAKFDAMVVMPCSMGTLGRIANGVSDDAVTRAADVFLKEGHKLVLVPRETPLNLVHLRNMTSLAEAGAVILPAMPSFYGGQKTLEDAANTVVSRVMDRIGLDNNLSLRWKS